MKASEANFLSFMNGPRQFIIPIYQRTYSWTLTQCHQLWNDVIQSVTDDDVHGHFLGSIVYVERGLYQVSSVAELLVIDGQQRLTTLTLLLAALRERIRDDGDSGIISVSRINNYYLFNSEESGDLHYKLLLTQSDGATLASIVDGAVAPMNPSPRVMENYKYFLDQIKQSSLGVDEIYRGIQKLIVVDISLNRDNDNPQLIFESLNSTGLALSQADLIRNYVLMGLEPSDQESLYNHHWHPMEESFGQDNYSSRFDSFMRDFLTIQTGRIPNIRGVYDAFKSFAQGANSGSIAQIVADIHQYSKYYVNIALGHEPDSVLRTAFRDLSILRVDVAYPFLLELYASYDHDELLRDDFAAVARLVESYVIRRAICGIPTNSLNKTFAGLAKDLCGDGLLEQLQVAFWSMRSYKRFPDNEEFQREFVVKDIYNLTNRRNYILRKLENTGRKEKVLINDYTIEHIIPQNSNLSLEWQGMLGDSWQDIQHRYLHTIGNLTLTGYNAELSDRPFQEKLNMHGGFRDSPIRLNESVRKCTKWNEEAIQDRGLELAQLACKVWPSAQPSPKSLEKLQKLSASARGMIYRLSDHTHLRGYTLELFELLRTRIVNLDASVSEEILKLYIAYKTDTNFVDVVPQASGLRLSLNVEFSSISDPKGLCKDVSNLGRWGNGDVEFRLTSEDEINYAMYLIHQSFDVHSDASD